MPKNDTNPPPAFTAISDQWEAATRNVLAKIVEARRADAAAGGAGPAILLVPALTALQALQPETVTSMLAYAINVVAESDWVWL